MNICPNLSNKQIKAEFDQLTRIFGEDCAYLLWDRSNGMGLKLAPNGASSKLYQDLLELHNGDERAALIDKARTYTDKYKDAFGDWINNSKEVSDFVDQNGEPLSRFVAKRKERNTSENDISYHISYAEKIKHIASELRKKIAEGNYTLSEARLYVAKQNKKYGTNFQVFQDEEGKYYPKGVSGPKLKLSDNHYKKSQEEGPRRNTEYLSNEDAKAVVGFLSKMFPELTVVIQSHEEYANGDGPRGSGFSTGYILGDHIFLDGSKITIETTAEEFFHPFVECFAKQQPDVYKQLLQQAKDEFPTLYKEILSVYSSSTKYTKEDFDKELLTQALSRYFSAQLNGDINKHNKLDDIIDKFLSYVKELLALMDISGPFLPIWKHPNGNVVVGIEHLENITSLQDLATILNTYGLAFSVGDGIKGGKRTYHIENVKQDQQVNTGSASDTGVTSFELKQRLKQLGEEREKQCGI